MDNQHTGGGIYIIYCSHNGRSYVGSSVNVRRRLNGHRSALNRGDHRNAILQRSWCKYGGCGFTFNVVERVDDVQNLLVREQHWIDVTTDKFNIHPVAGATRGVKRTAETRARISASNKGRVMSPEHCAAISERTKGRKHTDATKLKMSAVRKGIPKPPLSESHRKAISDAQRGSTRVFTEEHKQRLREAALARPPLSQSVKDKISAAHKGKTREFTVEHKAAIKAAWIIRKQLKEQLI